MIVALSQEVCQLVQEKDNLDRIKNDTNSIKDTFDALQKIEEVAKQVRAYRIVLREQLPEQTIRQIQVVTERVLRELAISRDNFENEIRQVKQLSDIRRRLQDVLKDIKVQWHSYAEEQIHEPLELLQLVGYLPEVVSQQYIYDSLKEKLQQATDVPPDTAELLIQFDQYLQEIKQRLGDITELGFAIKTFLQRTLNGQATLEDLTDEVLMWCRQGHHTRAFAIAFANKGAGGDKR